jgi:hypothetical protein
VREVSVATKKKPSRAHNPKKHATDPKPASGRSNKSPAVDAWFDRLDHPLKPLMLKVRRVILASDKRVTESVKWSTPTYSYNGDIASFIPQAKSFVSLMFHRGSEIPGRHRRLEGNARLARTMRFASGEELKRHTSDLQKVIRAWCEFKSK